MARIRYAHLKPVDLSQFPPEPPTKEDALRVEVKIDPLSDCEAKSALLATVTIPRRTWVKIFFPLKFDQHFKSGDTLPVGPRMARAYSLGNVVSCAYPPWSGNCAAKCT